MLGEIFVSNKLSALDVFKLASTAVKAGASTLDDLAKAGNSGGAVKNLARDLTKAMLKDCVSKQ